jgi:F0F1-type ATP synthase epsilon subunit
MHLKITSLEWLIRDEDVKQLTVNTLNGQITVLPGHDNMISVLAPGLIKLVPSILQHERTFEFLTDKEYIVFGCLGGVLKIEGDKLQILTNMIILDNQSPLAVLQESQMKLKEQIRQSVVSSPAEVDNLEAELLKIDIEMKIALYKNI